MKLLALMCVVIQSSVLVSCQDDTVTVTSDVGNIMGRRLTRMFGNQTYSVDTFRGIPYAESTHGERRFIRPSARAYFKETFDATKPSVACPQNMKMDATPQYERTVSEDCLRLSIVTPAGASSGGTSKAVMVFIYGGGFQVGFQEMYLSTALPGLNDVIYVTMNYRVGIYGFLANRERGMTGNNGLWDQQMALQWVKANIAAFGGDPSRITVFGESAGAASVIYQAMKEGNEGLFSRAIAESGSVGPVWSFSKNPDADSVRFAEKVGCSGPGWIRCLQEMNLDTLQSYIDTTDVFLPIFDGDFVNYNPRELFTNDNLWLGPFKELDLIMGLNSNEGFMTIQGELGLPIKDFTDGLTEDEFNRFTEYLWTSSNMVASPALLASVKHVYTDWDMPDDPIARRNEFMEIFVDDFATAIVNRLRSHVRAGGMATAYMYVFDIRPSWTQAPEWVEGANHFDEVPYVLGFPPMWFGEGDPAATLPDRDIQIAKNIMAYWTQFAKTGYDVESIDPSNSCCITKCFCDFIILFTRILSDYNIIVRICH